MGIWQFKSELEDTSFMYLYPQEYKRLNRKIRQHQKKYQDTLEKARDIMQRQLNLDPTLQQVCAMEADCFNRVIYAQPFTASLQG